MEGVYRIARGWARRRFPDRQVVSPEELGEWWDVHPDVMRKLLGKPNIPISTVIDFMMHVMIRMEMIRDEYPLGPEDWEGEIGED